MSSAAKSSADAATQASIDAPDVFAQEREQRKEEQEQEQEQPRDKGQRMALRILHLKAEVEERRRAGLREEGAHEKTRRDLQSSERAKRVLADLLLAGNDQPVEWWLNRVTAMRHLEPGLALCLLVRLHRQPPQVPLVDLVGYCTSQGWEEGVRILLSEQVRWEPHMLRAMLRAACDACPRWDMPRHHDDALAPLVEALYQATPDHRRKWLVRRRGGKGLNPLFADLVVRALRMGALYPAETLLGVALIRAGVWRSRLPRRRDDDWSGCSTPITYLSDTESEDSASDRGSLP